MHCGLSRVKNTIYKPLSLEEYTLQEKYCDERFLIVTMGYVNQFCKHFMPSIHAWRNAFLSDKFHSELFIFLWFSLFY